MICELCGKRINEGKRINFMGAIMVVCNDCAVAGNIISTVKQESKKEKEKKEIKYIEFQPPSYELVENFGKKIKEAREKANMKQEDLAKKINEPVSLIKRIEGNYEPSRKVIEKIEKALGIKLIKEPSELELKELKDLKYCHSHEDKNVLTLGDIVKIRKKKL